MKNKKISFLILLISVSLITTFFISMGYDYYWHITAGKYMITNNTILTKDVFSWYLNNASWMSHEWLYECIIYIFKMVFKSSHIIVYSFINVFILLFILFFHNKNNYSKNTLFTIIWLAIYILLNVVLITPRPHLISSWLIALTIYLLYELKKKEDSKKIYLLPIVTIIWANIHGGSSNLSYLLCLLFIVTGMFNLNNKYIKIEKLTKKQMIKYIIIFILTILAININPHGYKMIYYPYENIFNKFMQKNITEWQPTTLTEPYHYIYFITIITLLIIMIKSKKKIKLLDLLLLIIFSYMGIRSIRFWNYIYIVSSFFIFDYIQKREDDNNTNLTLFIVSIILTSIFVFNYKNIQEKTINNKVISDKIIVKLKKEKPQRLFNIYDYGGYLIYKDIAVFVDGRADLYSNYNYKDYIEISNYGKKTKELIDKYNFDYFIVNRKFKIYQYLEKSEDYIKVSSDNNSIIYKKK